MTFCDSSNVPDVSRKSIIVFSHSPLSPWERPGEGLSVRVSPPREGLLIQLFDLHNYAKYTQALFTSTFTETPCGQARYKLDAKRPFLDTPSVLSPLTRSASAPTPLPLGVGRGGGSSAPHCHQLGAGPPDLAQALTIVHNRLAHSTPPAQIFQVFSFSSSQAQRAKCHPEGVTQQSPGSHASCAPWVCGANEGMNEARVAPIG